MSQRHDQCRERLREANGFTSRGQPDVLIVLSDVAGDEPHQLCRCDAVKEHQRSGNAYVGGKLVVVQASVQLLPKAVVQRLY